MSAGEIAVLVACVVCRAWPWSGCWWRCGRCAARPAGWPRCADDLRRQTVPLVVDAHRVVDQAATEMERVGCGARLHRVGPRHRRLGLEAGLPGIRQPGGEGAGRASRRGHRYPPAGLPGRDRHATTPVNAPRSANGRERTPLTVPKRTFWLVAGAAIGAGSTLWAERKVRRTVQEAAARLQPDALVVEVGRSARQVAGSAGRPGARRGVLGPRRDAATRGAAVGRAGPPRPRSRAPDAAAGPSLRPAGHRAVPMATR